MTRNQNIAYRLRWLILIVGLLCLAAGVWWVVVAPPLEHGAGTIGTLPHAALHSVTSLVGIDDVEEPWIGVPYLGVFLVTQWLFLRPRKGLAVRIMSVGRPMKLAVVAAAFIAMLLTAGMVATLLEMPNRWYNDWNFPENKFLTFALFCGIPMIVWLVWSVIFFVYWRQGDHYTQMGKMIRGLLGGSVLELIAATAIYVWNPQKEDCYCARGSYTGLVLGGTVALWCFGPGIVLLFMREKYRRHKFNLCINCGYDLRGSIPAGATSCPECGAAMAGSQATESHLIE